MHEIVSGTRCSLGLVDQRDLQIDDTLLGIAQADRQTLTEIAHLLAGSAGRGTQQFFGVGNHDLQVRNQFFLVGNAHFFSHFQSPV